MVVDDERKERAEEHKAKERPQPLGASRNWISGGYGARLGPVFVFDRR